MKVIVTCSLLLFLMAAVLLYRESNKSLEETVLASIPQIAIFQKDAEHYESDEPKIQRLYYPNGVLYSETRYQYGMKNGIVRSYYPSGTLKSEETFVNNILPGSATYYDEDGQEERQIQYKSNEAAINIFKDNTPF